MRSLATATAAHPRLRTGLAGLALVVVLIAAGREVVHGSTLPIVGLFAMAGLVVLALLRRGLFLGLLVLAALNGVPFIDTSHYVANHIAGQDLVCLAMVAVAAIWARQDRRTGPPTALGRRLEWCGGLLLLWCAFSVLRTTVAGHASTLGALRFGRDFIYFGALLVFLPRIRLTRRELEDLVKSLAVGVLIFSVGQILTVEGIANPSYIVHAASVAQTLGLTRVYAPMNDLLFAGVAVAVATTALAPQRSRTRRLAVPVALLLATSLVLQLTRARWIALIVSLVVVSLWFALQADRRLAGTLRRRLLVFLLAAVALVVGLSVIAPGVLSAGPLVQRVVSIFTDVGSASSTVAVRQHVASQMLQLLGTHWPMGLGLIPPSAHYYLAFPSGSLRDPDVGVLNAVMTIGVIGAALIYLPLLAAMAHCMRRVRTYRRVQYPWLNYGGQIYLVAAMAASITLVTLFSVGGLVLTALILTLLAQASVSGGERPDPAEPETVSAAHLEAWPVLAGSPR